MRAVLLDAPGSLESALRIADVPVPAPGPGEVLIRVEACGVCRSNLHMIEGDWVAFGVPAKQPIIPGHEVVGTVESTGPGVEHVSTGDRVGVQPLWSTCGWCSYCISAREHLCLNKETTGETVDGGYAEYMLANALHTYAVPDNLDSAEAAPLFCPGVTAYSAVVNARVRPGDRVAIFGLGGVGHMVVQFARLAGAEVIAVARGREHLAVARELGAAQTIDAREPDALRELEAGGGVDAAIVFAPSDEVARQAVRATRRGGVVVLGINADLGQLTFFENRSIVGSVIGNRAQMREVLRLAAAGRIRTVTESHPLDDAVDVLRRLQRGEIRSRAVLTPAAVTLSASAAGSSPESLRRG